MAEGTAGTDASGPQTANPNANATPRSLAREVATLRSDAKEAVVMRKTRLDRETAILKQAEELLVEACKVCVDLGMRHAEVAAAAGVSPSTLSTWVRVPKGPDGQTELPTEPEAEEDPGPRAANAARPVSREMDAPIEPDPDVVGLEG